MHIGLFFQEITERALEPTCKKNMGLLEITCLPSDTTAEAGLILAHQTPGYGPSSQASPHQVPENRRP